MKTRWKWLIIGYLLTLAITSIWLAYNAMFERSYVMLSFQDSIFLFVYYALPIPNFLHIISMSIGYYFGWVKEKESKGKKDKLKLQLKEELDELSLTEIEDKIQKWKEKGYSVDEIEEMVEEYKLLK